MRNVNKNSKRQRIIAMDVGDEMTFTRDEIKPSSLGSILCAIRRDEGQAYSYKIDGQVLRVTRLS